jgi:hypothetical protein
MFKRADALRSRFCRPCSAAAGTPLALRAIHIIGYLGGVFLVPADLTGRTAPAAQKEPLRVSL